MFNLQQTLEQRLAVLQGKSIKGKPKSKSKIELNDTSDIYITRSLTQAGILDKQGNLRKFKLSN